MSSLRGRISLALFVFGLATLVTMGGTLWVALRDLHRDASLASLAELTVPYSAQARQRFPLELLRPREPGERAGPELIRRFRATREGRLEQDALAAFVRLTQEEIDDAGISVLLVQDGSLFVRDPQTGTITASTTAPAVDIPELRGDVETGTTDIEGLGTVLYAATPIRNPQADRSIPALILAREDDSAQLATADLVRALGIAALVLLVIGIPLAAGLSRSVSRPLRRLAEASGVVARGEIPDQLPTSGPSEVAHATEAFNAMATEVGATRHAQRQLLADVRHDLRTPLTVIGGFSQALRDGTATGADADRAAEAISDEASRLERMLDDLDHLASPPGDGPALRIEPLDGLEVASAAVDRFAAEAEANGQDLALDPDATSVSLLADRDAVDRILGNIVVNALAHAPSPGGHARLEVQSTDGTPTGAGVPDGRAGRGGVVLAVTDDGPGIPTDALPFVFDRFYRGDPSRSGAGSGLGLAIVRDLAKELDGRAFAENLNGGGARVGVVLPRAGPAVDGHGPA